MKRNGKKIKSNDQLLRGGKKYKGIVLFVIAVLIGLIVFGWWDNQWVLKINEQKVSKDEYEFYKRINPRLKTEELQKQIVEDKIQFQQAKKYDIETFDDYDSLLREMKKENQKNIEKVKNGEVIYGLMKYDEETYYSYSLSIVINKLKKELSQNISENAIQNYYEQHQEEFRTIDSKKLYRVLADKSILENLKNQKISEEQLKSISGLSYESVELNESNLRNWIKYRDDELSGVNELDNETWSQIFEESEKSVAYYCISSEHGTIQTLNDVNETIKLRLEKQKYQNLLTEWIKDAQVKNK